MYIKYVKFIKEKKLIGGFFDEIFRYTNEAIYGMRETLTALEMGAVETLILLGKLGPDQAPER
jgi:peptide chain release factor subunit 1